MKHPPVPRRRIYDLYWYFASERQAAFERRAAGAVPPWTDDSVLLTYKFCNVYRAADRVSQYLIRHVAYHTETDTNPEDRVFQIVAFRTFSKMETWETVQQLVGRYPTLDDLASCRFKGALDETKHRNGGLYTGAFILCATNAYGQARKHHNHVELFRHMFLHDRLAEKILDARSLRDIYQLLHGYPLMGDFMSYQTAVDLNYSALINFSENDFTKPGPGALRGIRKAFESLGDYTPDEIVHWMVDRQDDELARLGLQFNGLWGRPLHAIDCQGLFCELDKYCRIAAPELASARKRIKAKFAPNNEPVPFFFPPKWSLNERLAQAAALAEQTPVGAGLW